MLSSKKVLLVGASPGEGTQAKKGFLSPSLGIYRLKSFIESYGHSCTVIEPSILDAHRFIWSQGHLFDIIGFSPLHLTLEHDLALILLATRKTYSLIVVGGIEATLNPEIFRKYAPEAYLVQGEGEKPLLSLCEDDFISCNPLTEKEYREVNLGIDFTQIPYDTFWRETINRHPDVSIEEANTIRHVTSSHCPHHCTFCSSKNFLNGKPKQLTGENIISMVSKSVKAWPNTTQIFFQDDNFLLGKTGKDRWKSISDKDFPVPFIGQSRLDDVTPDILPHLGNFKLISVGVESFSQNILDEFKKGLRASSIDSRLQDIQEAGIETYLNIILTSPYCTKEDVKFTMDKCEEWINRGAQLGINLYVDAYPGTEITENSEITYKTVKVRDTGIKFEKMWKMYPMDKEIRDAVKKTEAVLELSPLRSSQRSQIILKEMKKNLD